MVASLRELLDQRANDTAGAVVVSAPGGALTWSRLRDRARTVAAALVRDGVAAQDRVVFWRGQERRIG